MLGEHFTIILQPRPLAKVSIFVVAFPLLCSFLHLTEVVLAVRAPGGGKKAHLTRFPLALPPYPLTNIPCWERLIQLLSPW